MWTLLTKTGLEPNKDHLATSGVRFLTTVANSVHHSLFAGGYPSPGVPRSPSSSPTFSSGRTTRSVREQLGGGVRSPRARGSDSDTRRRGACELARLGGEISRGDDAVGERVRHRPPRSTRGRPGQLVESERRGGVPRHLAHGQVAVRGEGRDGDERARLHHRFFPAANRARARRRRRQPARRRRRPRGAPRRRSQVPHHLPRADPQGDGPPGHPRRRRAPHLRLQRGAHIRGKLPGATPHRPRTRPRGISARRARRAQVPIRGRAGARAERAG